MSKEKVWTNEPLGIFLSVLGYREEDEWVALALEMDIRGYGDTFDSAQDDLFDLVNMQIGFALFKKQPSMIFKPSDPKYFMLYQGLREKSIQRFGLESEEEDFAIRGMPLPPPHVIAAQYKDHFQSVDG